MDEFQKHAEQKKLEAKGYNLVIYVYEVLECVKMVIRTVVVSGVEVGITEKEHKELSVEVEVFYILIEMWVTWVNECQNSFTCTPKIYAFHGM